MTVLVLRALGLGDFFTGLPALALLRQALPHEHIVLAVSDEYRELALLSGSVDATVHGHELQPLRDPPGRPELAVDLHGNGPASRALLAETRPRRLLAFGRDGPQWHPAEHEVTRWCRVIRQGLPAADLIDPPADGALPIPPGAPVVAGRTLLHCGAKSPARRWPAPRFAAVAAELRRAGHDVVITGGPRERGLTQTIARRAGVAAAELTSLPELLALVAAARLVISGDTGIAHVATNYRTPSVVLFGPVSPAIWGPPPQPYHQVLWHGDGMGNPHGDQLDPALDMITPAEVLAACQRALLPAAEAAHG